MATTSQSTSWTGGKSRIALVGARKYAVYGLVLYIVGFVLNGVGNSVGGTEPLIPLGDTLSALGFVLTVLGAALAGSTLREMVVVGLIYGLGIFYLAEPHEIHKASAIGFGLEHIQHIGIGLALVTTATALSAILALYRSRSLVRAR